MENVYGNFFFDKTYMLDKYYLKSFRFDMIYTTKVYIPRVYGLEYCFDNNSFDIDTLFYCFVSQFISEGDIYLRLL